MLNVPVGAWANGVWQVSAKDRNMGQFSEALRRGNQDRQNTPRFRSADFSRLVRFCFRIAHRRRAVKHILFVPAIVILVLVSAAVPIFAHHSWPVNLSQLVTVKGT